MELLKIQNALQGVFYLATTDGDQPHVRPFDGAVVIDDKLYIATNNNKNVFKQIFKNPKIEIFEMENNTIRFTARAYPAEEKSEEVYRALEKKITDTSIALELRNIKGYYRDTMGGELEL